MSIKNEKDTGNQICMAGQKCEVEGKVSNVGVWAEHGHHGQYQTNHQPRVSPEKNVFFFFLGNEQLAMIK
jgi:hypothetical protein